MIERLRCSLTGRFFFARPRKVIPFSGNRKLYERNGFSCDTTRTPATENQNGTSVAAKIPSARESRFGKERTTSASADAHFTNVEYSLLLAVRYLLT